MNQAVKGINNKAEIKALLQARGIEALQNKAGFIPQQKMTSVPRTHFQLCTKARLKEGEWCGDRLDHDGQSWTFHMIYYCGNQVYIEQEYFEPTWNKTKLNIYKAHNSKKTSLLYDIE